LVAPWTAGKGYAAKLERMSAACHLDDHDPGPIPHNNSVAQSRLFMLDFEYGHRDKPKGRAAAGRPRAVAASAAECGIKEARCRRHV